MPTRDRPTQARLAVKWLFKHVLEKKSLSVTSHSQTHEKNCLFLISERTKKVMFSCSVVGKKKN